MMDKRQFSSLALGDKCYLVHNNEVCLAIKCKQKNGDVVAVVMEGKDKGICFYFYPESLVLIECST